MSSKQPWLDQYPEDMPHSIDPQIYPSINAVIDEAFERFRHRPAFANFGRVLSYDDIDRLSWNFASYLTNELKLQRGERIAIMMPNILQYPIVLFAALRAGLVVVNTNPLYTGRELRHQLDDSGAKAIVVVDNFAATVQSVLKDTLVEHVITTSIGDMLGLAKGALINFVLKYVKKAVPDFSIDGAVRFTDALDKGAGLPRPEVDVGHEDIAFLQYTGGTTGLAKGAMLTHANMMANMLQAGAWIGDKVKKGEETIITALPLYHIFSLTANCLVFMRLGGLNWLITNPRDMPAFVKELKQVELHCADRRQHAVQWPAQHGRFRTGWISRACKLTLGGGMAVQRVGGRALEGSHRLHSRRSVRADGDFTGRVHQSAGPA